MVGGWTQQRDVPEPPKESFRNWWKKHEDETAQRLDRDGATLDARAEVPGSDRSAPADGSAAGQGVASSRGSAAGKSSAAGGGSAGGESSGVSGARADDVAGGVSEANADPTEHNDRNAGRRTEENGEQA